MAQTPDSPENTRPAGYSWQLTALTIVCLAPFINKAYCIDDPLFLWTAQQIARSPADFYGFSVNWYGIVEPMSTVTKNPPLWCYALALFSQVSTSEIWLHFFCWIPAIAMIIGTSKLAEALGGNPVMAALLALSSPVFLVSSTNVMCDTALAAGWVWSILLWNRGLKLDSHLHFACSAMLIAATSLTKYFGIALLPLLCVYTLAYKPRRSASLAWMAIPVTILACYQIKTGAMYERGLLLDAAGFSMKIKLMYLTNVLHNGAEMLSYLGGCLLSFVFVTIRLWKPRSLLWLLIPAGFCIAAGGPWIGIDGQIPPRMTSLPWSIRLQAGLFGAAGAMLIVHCLDDIRRFRSAESLLLLLWVAGTLVFASCLNWTVNARVYLPLVPAVSIVIARRLSKTDPSQPQQEPFRRFRWREAIPILPGFVLGLLVAFGDQALANSARHASRDLVSQLSPASRVVWFQGHWGFQYYFERAGGRPMDFSNLDLAPGDLVVVPVDNINLKWPPAGVCRQIDVRSYPLVVPCSTMSNQLRTGFYGSPWGPAPVPFAFGQAPHERYVILELQKRNRTLPAPSRR